uniref:pilus assembly protein n=1 Tax=Thiobacillus sp. TaxID=924 RepID=UPI0025F9CA77
QCALYEVVKRLPTYNQNYPELSSVVNIGMMVYNANNIKDINNANCGGSNGGCLAVPLMPLNDANKAKMLAWIKSWRTTGGAGDGYIKASGEAIGATMQESWAYLTGHTGLSGRSYAAIKPTLGCNTYAVFVGNSYSSSGKPGDATGDAGPRNALLGTNTNADKNANPAATAAQTTILTNTLKTSCGKGSFTFPASNHENGGFYADEWARYMASQSIETYTVGLLGSSCQESYEALLTSMGSEAVGGGAYFRTTNYEQLVKALLTIFSEVQSKNSAFAAVSLPVSVNTQGTYLNQVFVGMFRPEKDGMPRWHGNLKQYKLGILNNRLQLVDAKDNPAISGNNTGFIAECAQSFWTPSTQDDYWWFRPQGSCLLSANMDVSNTPDGNIVEKGAQGYKLRSLGTFADRKVYTCATDIGSCTELLDFDTTIPPTKFGADVTDAERDILVNWQIGENSQPESGTDYKVRPSVHGDVMHSRPVAINYGSDAAPEVVVFYGGNDGMLRAVNGNRDGGLSVGGASPGEELWSFVAPEFYPSVERVYDNMVPVSFLGNTTCTPVAPETTCVEPRPKPYGFDGPVMAHREGGDTWIYATMRRGGRAVYAFDVSDPDKTPVLKWKRGCDASGCSAGLENIGQTWSAPKVLKAKGYEDGKVALLIMGGGYDACEDADDGTANHNCTSPSKGSEIYVLDANSGDVVPTGISLGGRGVAADVFVVTDTTTGNAELAYAVDLGGNIWRINIGSDAPADWTATQVASLGCDTTAPCSANRKFQFTVDVVLDNGKYLLMVGSGDREKPLTGYKAAYEVKNYFFMVMDDPSDPNWFESEKANCEGNAVICLESLVPVSNSGASPTPATVAEHKGWYLELHPHEQVVTSAITIFGTTNFSTHTPAVYKTGECSANLGTARVYNVSYATAGGVYGETNRSSEIAGGGLAPSPVAGMVTLDGSTEAVPFCIGCDPQSALQGSDPPPPPPLNQPKSRVYWQVEQ